MSKFPPERIELLRSDLASGIDDLQKFSDRAVSIELEMLDEIERLQAELDSIKKMLFGTIHGINFLYAQRNRAFQLPGMHDGSISEECKLICNEEYKLLSKLIAESKGTSDEQEGSSQLLDA